MSTNYRIETALQAAREFIARVPAPPIKGLRDLIVVKPLDQKYGIIFMAETAESLTVHEPGGGSDSFLGVVVAVGLGDRLLVGTCKACGTRAQRNIDHLIGSNWHRARGLRKCGNCGESEFEDRHIERLPLEVKRGDVLVFPRRPQSPGGEFEMELEGEKYVAFFEQQFAFGVVEEAA